MQVFTYKDYIQAIHTFRMNTIMNLAEHKEEYSLKDSKEKILKEIFRDKNKMVSFLNSYIQLNKKISEEQLILCDVSKTKLSANEIIFKIKKKEVFFLICYYSKIDINFPYKLLSVCVEIFKKWSKTKKARDSKIYPKVIPIIVYAGNEKWTFPKKINSNYLKETTYGENRINLSYNLVDLSKVSTEELFSTYFIKYNEIREKEDNNGKNIRSKKY